jgi:hypothetical protein
MSDPYKVVVGGPGGLGRIIIREVAARPEFELVGGLAYSDPKNGVDLGTVVVNRQTTLIAGRHARAEFRNEARIIQIAENLSRQVVHPKSALWVAWLVVTAAGKISDDEATLLRHLVRLLREDHGVVDDDLARCRCE